MWPDIPREQEKRRILDEKCIQLSSCAPEKTVPIGKLGLVSREMRKKTGLIVLDALYSGGATQIRKSSKGV